MKYLIPDVMEVKTSLSKKTVLNLFVDVLVPFYSLLILSDDVIYFRYNPRTAVLTYPIWSIALYIFVAFCECRPVKMTNVISIVVIYQNPTSPPEVTAQHTRKWNVNKLTVVVTTY